MEGAARRVRRLVCCITCPTTFVLVGFAGDRAESVSLRVWGDRVALKSTSGTLLALVEPHAFTHVAARLKKRSGVSQSTSGAVIISTEAALRNSGLPYAPLDCPHYRIAIGRQADTKASTSWKATMHL